MAGTVAGGGGDAGPCEANGALKAHSNDTTTETGRERVDIRSSGAVRGIIATVACHRASEATSAALSVMRGITMKPTTMPLVDIDDQTVARVGDSDRHWARDAECGARHQEWRHRIGF